MVITLDFQSSNEGSIPSIRSVLGPIVYRLGHMVFIHKSRVRLPVGLQKGISYNGYYDGFANHKLGFNSLYLHFKVL